MLSTIPFHNNLLRTDLGNGVKASHTHVLLYGAIEIHAMGEKGCVASNSRLSKEIGLSISRIKNLLVEMSFGGWITVELDEQRNRTRITPHGEIIFNNGGVPHTVQGRTASGNIDNSIDNNTTYSASEDATIPSSNSNFGGESENNTALVVENTTPDEPNTNKLMWDVVKKYNLPITNANHIRKWATDLDKMPDGRAYLQALLDKDFRTMEGEFKPTLNTAFEIISKKLKIQRFLNGGEDAPKYDSRVFE